jgi:hypothetical protein
MTEEAVLDGLGASIRRDLDSFLMAAHNLYDIGKVLPFPYDAVGVYSNAFLHDFAGFAHKVEAYVDLVTKREERRDG